MVWGVGGACFIVGGLWSSNAIRRIWLGLGCGDGFRNQGCSVFEVRGVGLGVWGSKFGFG